MKLTTVVAVAVAGVVVITAIHLMRTPAITYILAGAFLLFVALIAAGAEGRMNRGEQDRSE